MTNQATDYEIIPESLAARWAWRVSLIPLLGIPLFIVLALIAFVEIKRRYKNDWVDFWFLRRGIILLLGVNSVLYFGIYLLGYSGYYPKVYDKAFYFLPKHGIYNPLPEEPKELRIQYQDQYWFGLINGKQTASMLGKKYYEIFYDHDKPCGVWTLFDVDDGQKIAQGKCAPGQGGEFVTFYAYKRYLNSFGRTRKVGNWRYWQNGELIKDETYDDNGKIIASNEYWTPPAPTDED